MWDHTEQEQEVHLSFSEMNSKHSPQFPTKLLSHNEKNQKVFLGYDNSIPGAPRASSGITIFSLLLKLSRQFRLPHSSELAAADQEGLKLCSPGWEPSAQGLFCRTPMPLLCVSIWKYIHLYRHLELQAEGRCGSGLHLKCSLVLNYLDAGFASQCPESPIYILVLHWKAPVDVAFSWRLY